MTTTPRRPMPIPSTSAAGMEPRGSHSPVDLPTPPDGVALGGGAATAPARLPPVFGTRATKMPVPAYRAELPRTLGVAYAGLRSHGTTSLFALSAERQHAAEEDADMSVDDVFSASGHADDRRSRTEPPAEVEEYVSPALAPRSVETDESVPSLEGGSLGEQRHIPVPLEAPSPSLSARRSMSFRAMDALALTAGPSNRRAPYSVPSRSPGSLGPLGQIYQQMQMKPGSRARIAPWAHAPTAPRSGGAVRRRAPAILHSTSAPSHHETMFDDEETDDEVAGMDDDATDDDAEIAPRAHDVRVHRYTSDDEFGAPLAWRQPLAYRARAAPPAAAALYATSAPMQSSAALAISPDDGKQAAQVHMAAAALDRLSMAGAVDDGRPRLEETRMRDENDEVAAIRDRLGGAANCSAFISKLWHLMINPELYGKYIHWNEAGDTIILNNEPEVASEFAAEVLPKLFKHGNNASFVRQLNLYGFQRVSSSRLLDAAELQAIFARGLDRRDARFAGGATYNTAAELYGAHSSFTHPRFRRGQEAWLASMKPRSSKKTKKPEEKREDR